MVHKKYNDSRSLIAIQIIYNLAELVIPLALQQELTLQLSVRPSKQLIAIHSILIEPIQLSVCPRGYNFFVLVRLRTTT